MCYTIFPQIFRKKEAMPMRILSLPITPALSGQTVRHLLRQELGLSSSLLKSF